jgi:hypothetical protein
LFCVDDLPHYVKGTRSKYVIDRLVCACDMVYASSDQVDLGWGHNIKRSWICFMQTTNMCALNLLWEQEFWPNEGSNFGSIFLAKKL